MCRSFAWAQNNYFWHDKKNTKEIFTLVDFHFFLFLYIVSLNFSSIVRRQIFFSLFPQWWWLWWLCWSVIIAHIWVSEWEGTIEGKKYIIFHIHNHHSFADDHQCRRRNENNFFYMGECLRFFAILMREGGKIFHFMISDVSIW